MNRGGPPAGLLPNAKFEEEIIELKAGDLCLLVSDGITEALGDSPQPGQDVIVTTAREHSSSATSICHAVMARAQEGLGPPGVQQWDDDRTVVVVTVVR